MNIFGSGPSLDDPEGNPARQAVAALRGYAYQLYATGLAWLSLPDGAYLYLEVAEDYAVATNDALSGTQVRDTRESGTITLQSKWARNTIDTYVDLVQRNPGRVVSIHYLTTSQIGLEKKKAHRVDEQPALQHWRRAASGAEIEPLRRLIENLDLAEDTLAYLKGLSDDAFRRQFLQRIHWHCGAPGIHEIRTDFEDALVEYSATARRLSSITARKLAPSVLERVLLTAISQDRRTLRRADLLELIDKAALVSVPIEQLASAFQSETSSHSITREPMLLPAGDLPLPTLHAPRVTLVSTIDEARRVGGLAIVSGATGLGKSILARLVAEHDGASWVIADFRHLTPAETSSRLAHLRGELATSNSADVILDDLNGLDDPKVRDAVARLLVTLRRRDGTALITTYRSPTNTTLQYFGPDFSTPVEVPYFEREEVADLINQTGGDLKYSDAVYRASAEGHPQMTMAKVLHLKAQNWSRKALAATLGGNLSLPSSSERRAVRKRLVETLPDPAQSLLLRTSLVRGSFDRELAISIAGLDPPVALPGVVLDELVGPWIEPFRRGRFRVSPLVEGAAEEVLSTSECRKIHRCVAETTMMRADAINIADAPVAMHHALRSEDTGLVVAFAQSVITCDVETIDALAPFLTELMFLPTERAIFAQDLAAAAMMRLAQLLILISHGSEKQVKACWQALEHERRTVKGERLFEGFALSKLLLHPRTGELFENWLDMLFRFDRLCLAEPKMAETSSSFTSETEGAPHPTGVLFAGQLGSVTTVARFRAIMERLELEDPDTRTRVLSSFRPGRGDVSVLVNHGWLRESRRENFDWDAAAKDYGACFELAIKWGDSVLASRCAIAQAVCLDENGDDAERAFACLTEAEAKIGPDVALGRARARIHWRRRDHAAALPLLTAAAEVGGQDQIERAYIAREAGISAANLGDWGAACDWFERAQSSAESASDIPSVRAMAIGLLADTAQAAYKAGRYNTSIEKIRDALVALPLIDAEGDLPEAHCHRVVRHCLLWLFREITGELEDDCEELIYAPGAASNPEPLEEIRSHPVVALDMSFYMLADADAALAKPTGYFRNFRDDLVVGPVLSSEISAAIADDRNTILAHDPSNFLEKIRRHASMAKLLDTGKAREAAEELIDPIRGTIPLADILEDSPPDLCRTGEDYLLSFGISAALARDFDSIDTIVSQGLAAPEIAGLHPLLRRMGGSVGELTSDREGTANAIWTLRKDISARPEELCWTAVWLLLHVSNSRLQDGVLQPLIAWIFAGADHLVRNARFLLSLPATSVPPVEQVIANDDRSIAAVAHLLLALAPAAGTTFIPQVRDRLAQIAQSPEPA